MTPVPILIRGQAFPSIRAAARGLGVRVNTLWAAMERGTLDAVGLGRARPCELDGVAYPSRAAAARALGVTDATIRKRLKRRGLA